MQKSWRRGNRQAPAAAGGKQNSMSFPSLESRLGCEYINKSKEWSFCSCQVWNAVKVRWTSWGRWSGVQSKNMVRIFFFFLLFLSSRIHVEDVTCQQVFCLSTVQFLYKNTLISVPVPLPYCSEYNFNVNMSSIFSLHRKSRWPDWKGNSTNSNGISFLKNSCLLFNQY